MRPTSALEKRRVSLAWRAIVLPSLLLTAVFVGQSLLLEQQMSEHFETRRARERDNAIVELHRLIEDSARRMTEIAELVPGLEGMRAPLLRADRATVAHQFAWHWPDLQLNQGLYLMAIYDAEGRMLTREGDWPDSSRWRAATERAVNVTNATESPRRFLHCDSDCLHVSVTPTLIDGRHSGVMLVARPLTESMVEYHNAIGQDVLLLMPGDTPRIIPLLINPDHGQPDLALTRELLSQTDWMRSTEARRLDDGKATWEVYVTPIRSNDGATQDRYLVLIDDVSPDSKDIGAIIGSSRAATAIGTLVALLTLTVTLWQPARRLRDVARTLPLIPARRYDEAREILAQQIQPNLTADEIDVLSASLLQLTRQLESLNAIVNQQMGDLTAERDFAENLLETVEVLILTLNTDGEIVSINRHAQAVIGRTQDDLRGTAFTALLPMENPHGLTASLLGAKDGSYRHQSVLRTPDGKDRHVLWTHSRLRGDARDGAVVLSAGLDITEQRAVQERVSWLNEHDPLTGLFNRHRTERDIEAAIADALAHRRKGALLLFDVDNFKDINDTSGHEAGDRLLRMIAVELESFVAGLPSGDTSTIGRVGGDEFVLLLRDAGKVEAMYAIERILDALQALTFPIDDAHHRVMVSVGLTLFPEHGRDAHQLLSHADMAMYHAKSRGSGQWHMFSPREDMQSHIADRMYWRDRIEKALLDERFELHFQPMLALADDKVHHYEVLLRMLDDNNAIVPPNKFIPVAERSGMISRIDRYVVEHALAKLREFMDRGEDITLAINLSAKAFEDELLIEVLTATIERFQVDPHHLIFELTETAAIADVTNTRLLMERLRALGCLFALDDFGVGFTSFNYLTDLPVDIVKIDGSFVREVSDNRTSQLIVEALVRIASGLGIVTVAEFCEDAQCLNKLRSLGVTMVQGFYIGRPSPRLLPAQS